MPKCKIIQEAQNCSQWFILGDHPDVTGFNSPFQEKCRLCGEDMSAHGWIDLSDSDESSPVCPGDWILTNARGQVSTWSDIAFKKVFKLC